MSDTDFDTLAAEILQDPVARVAYLENKLRREIADQLRGALRAQGVTPFALVYQCDVNALQALRLFGIEKGGDLNFHTLAVIADTYGLEVTLSVKKREDQKKA